MGDGSQSNNPWLQELPDPLSRACWDNYLTISAATAKELGIENWNVSNGALNGNMVNRFEGEEEGHSIEQYQHAIVTNVQNKGHILQFSEAEQLSLISIEIDRKNFR